MSEGHGENSSWFGPELDRSREALAKKGDFWFGQDVAVSEKTVIEEDSAVTKINLKLRKENFPDISGLSISTLHLLRTSTRSCYAQVGLEVKPDIGRLTEADIKRIIQGEEVDCSATALNHSHRAVELKGGLFRFFWLDAGKHLTGDKLVEAVGKIRIDGKEGDDWFLGQAGEEAAFLSDGNLKKETPITLGLKIQDKKLFVPPTAEDEPIRVDSRKNLFKYLEPIPRGFAPDFVVGETASVFIPENLVGVINLGMQDAGGRHSSSPLIDPGFVGPIRLEIIRPGQHPNFVELLLYEHTVSPKGAKDSSQGL